VSWGNEVGPETVTESSAGAGKYMAAGIAVGSRGSVQFRFKRTDAATEAWGAEIYPSLDDTTYSGTPIEVGRWPASQTEAELTAGNRAFLKARILNADPTPVDLVSVDVYYKPDGVNI